MRRLDASAILLEFFFFACLLTPGFLALPFSASEENNLGEEQNELWAVFLPQSPCGCCVGAGISLHPGPSADNLLLSRPNIVSVGEYPCSLVFYAIRAELEFGPWFP